MSAVVDWLRLSRAPLAVTAASNSVTACLVADSDVDIVPPLALLAVASSCFYLAGMILNDYFDRARDATLQPQRPIPSGRIAPGRALAAGVLLLLGGVGAVAPLGVQPALVGVALAAVIVGYDGLLKRWAVPGSIAMGGCRLVNGLLGTAVAGFALGGIAPTLQSVRPVLPPLAVFAFVTVLTYVSTLEDRPAPRGALPALGASLGLIAVLAALASPARLAGLVFCGPLALAAVAVGVRGGRMGSDRGGAGQMMKWMLRGLLLLDAGLLAGAGLWPWAALPLGLYVPFVLLARVVGPPKRPALAPASPGAVS